jgi:hypothetical protein
MPIEDQYNLFVDIERLDDDSGNTETYFPHIDDYPCTIQPLDDAYSQDVDGNFGKEWLMIGGKADVLEGDRAINRTTGDEYRITAVELMEFMNHSHIECRIRLSKP